MNNPQMSYKKPPTHLATAYNKVPALGVEPFHSPVNSPWSALYAT